MQKSIFLLPLTILITGCAPVVGSKSLIAWGIALLAVFGSIVSLYHDRNDERVAEEVDDLNAEARQYAVQCRNGHSDEKVIQLPTQKPEDGQDSVSRTASQRG